MSDSERMTPEDLTDISIKYVENRFEQVKQLSYETKFIAGTAYRDGYMDGREAALKIKEPEVSEYNEERHNLCADHIKLLNFIETHFVRKGDK